MFDNERLVLKQLAKWDSGFPKILQTVNFPDKTHGIVMDFLGVHLKRYVNLHSPSRESILRIGALLISSLEKLHRSGFVHGKIKPESILIMPAQNSMQEVTVSLIDFTFAKPFAIVESDS